MAYKPLAGDSLSTLGFLILLAPSVERATLTDSQFSITPDPFATLTPSLCALLSIRTGLATHPKIAAQISSTFARFFAVHGNGLPVKSPTCGFDTLSRKSTSQSDRRGMSPSGSYARSSFTMPSKSGFATYAAFQWNKVKR